MFVGLWLCIPFAMMNDAVGSIGDSAPDWLGEVGGVQDWSNWVDSGLIIVLGGNPWQVYFQRVVSSKSPTKAKFMSFSAAIVCIVMAIPAVLISIIARSSDWSATTLLSWHDKTATAGIPPHLQHLTLILVYQYLTPFWVSWIGLGTVLMAVMSSIPQFSLHLQCLAGTSTSG